MIAESKLIEAPHEVRFTFDRALIGAAYRPMFIWRGVFFFAFVVAVMLGNWILAGSLPPPYLYIVLVVSIVVPLRLWQVWRHSVSRTFDLWTRQTKDGVITIRFGESAFQVCHDTGSVRYDWDGLRRLHRGPKVWCIEVVKHTSILFPPDAATEEARAYVVERCRAAGVRV